ncbi:MAG: Pyridoxamine 5-phosphate oxidase [Blastococcus sp.]|nr:Pyridoxamine 5-phosphate oxidase [Blastococcus sp.]
MTTDFPATTRTTPSRNPERVSYDPATRRASRKELAATSVLRLPLTEVSVKVRSGQPNDDADDLGLPHWAGVLPLATVAGDPVPAPDLAADVVVPEHVRAWPRPVGGLSG